MLDILLVFSSVTIAVLTLLLGAKIDRWSTRRENINRSPWDEEFV